MRLFHFLKRYRCDRKAPVKNFRKKERSVELDDDRMPVGFDTMLVVDEFGSLGSISPNENVFGMTVTQVKDPEEFGSITDDSRLRIGHEAKAARDSRFLDVCDEIATRGYRSNTIYVDKRMPPNGYECWRGKTHVPLMLRKALDESEPLMDGNTFVVVDYHTAYGGSLGDLISKPYSRNGRIVDGDWFHSTGTQFGPVLQTEDYVAFASHKYIEGGASESDGSGEYIVVPDPIIENGRVVGYNESGSGFHVRHVDEDYQKAMSRIGTRIVRIREGDSFDDES